VIIYKRIKQISMLSKKARSCNIKTFSIFPLLILTLLQPALPLSAQLFIQAEDYSSMYGVQTEACTDLGGGTNVGWIDNNDWMEYELNVPIGGEYIFSMRSASLNGGGELDILSGNSLLETMIIPASGGWQNWVTVEGDPVFAEQGNHSIKLSAASGGFNLNWFEVRLFSPEDTDAPTIPQIIEENAGVHTISLTWNSSSDPTTTVTGYKIYNEGEFFGFTADTNFML